MGSTTLLLVVLVVFGFLVGRGLERLRTRALIFSGLIQVAVGLALGPKVGLGVLPQGTLQELMPLALLLTGVLGFLVGLRVKDILGREAALAGTLLTATVFALVGVALLVGVSAVVTLSTQGLVSQFVVVGKTLVAGELVTFGLSNQQFWLCLTLATTAAVASSAVFAAAEATFGAKGRVTGWLGTMARTGEFLTVFCYGMFLAASRALESANTLGLTVTEWTVAGVGAGVLCGLLFTLFVGREGEEEAIYLSAIGTIVFASGIGAALGVSPIFVNLVAGATVAFSSPHVSRLRGVLENLQVPVSVMLFLFVGALWEPISGWIWIVPGLYVLFRVVALYGFATVLVRTTVAGHPKVARMGQGMLCQDAIPIALGINFAVRFPEQGSLVLSTVLVGFLLTNLLGSWTLRRILIDNQEIQAGGAR